MALTGHIAIPGEFPPGMQGARYGHGEPPAHFALMWGTSERRPGTGSDLFDLSVFQLDRGRTPEDRHGNLEPGLFLVHFLDHAGEGGEGAVGDPDLLAGFESDRGLGPLDAFLDLIDDPFRLGLAD